MPLKDLSAGVSFFRFNPTEKYEGAISDHHPEHRAKHPHANKKELKYYQPTRYPPVIKHGVLENGPFSSVILARNLHVSWDFPAMFDDTKLPAISSRIEAPTTRSSHRRLHRTPLSWNLDGLRSDLWSSSCRKTCGARGLGDSNGGSWRPRCGIPNPYDWNVKSMMMS